MKFEVGKVYRHASGDLIHIIGGLRTTLHGGCLVAECSDSENLKPISQDEESLVGWSEATMEEWRSCFSLDYRTLKMVLPKEKDK